MKTKRTILVLLLLGLLSVATAALSPAAAAGFDAPSCPAMSTVFATASDISLSWLPQPQPATGCTFRVTCPNGGTVQCSDLRFGECSYLYTCPNLAVKCGVECLSTTKYCLGYNASNCAC